MLPPGSTPENADARGMFQSSLAVADFVDIGAGLYVDRIAASRGVDSRRDGRVIARSSADCQYCHIDSSSSVCCIELCCRYIAIGLPLEERV
jgi:hypothetical protein